MQKSNYYISAALILMVVLFGFTTIYTLNQISELKEKINTPTIIPNQLSQDKNQPTQELKTKNGKTLQDYNLDLYSLDTFLEEKTDNIDTSQWKKFHNTKYHFSFLYPPESELRTPSQEELEHMVVGQEYIDIFEIESEEWKKEWGIPMLKDQVSQTLATYVRELWIINRIIKDNPNMDVLLTTPSSTRIDGQDALYFSSNAFDDLSSGRSYSDLHTFIFFESPSGKKLKVTLPAGNATAKQILKTLRFD